MKVLLADLDSKLPNVALMKLSAHFKGAGHEVELVERPRRKFPFEDYRYGKWEGLDSYYAKRGGE